MALLYPGSRWRPLGAQTESLMRAHDVVCVHTMVGYLVSTDNYFRIYNGEGYQGTESHYGIGGKWGPDLGGDLDGAVYQWQDRAYQANANLDGNPRVISIETADNAERPIQLWTPAQLSALIKLIAWECSPAAHAECPSSWRCHQEGIPAVLIPDTLPSRRGIGYHAQGAAEHTEGEWWSTSTTKDCPTAVRIGQLKTTVIPAVQSILSGKEDDLSAADVEAISRKIDTKIDEFYRLLARGVLASGQVSAPHQFVSLSALRSRIDAVAGTTSTGTSTLETVRAAIEAIRADQSISGQREEKALAMLGQIEAELHYPGGAE